jgi:hypothetical protein
VDAIYYSLMLETRTSITSSYPPSTSCFRSLVFPGLCGALGLQDASKGRDSSSSVSRIAAAKVS